MPKAGFMEVKISGKTHSYAGEKKAEINEGVGIAVSWNDISETGISMIEEHGTESIDEYTEELPEPEEKLKRKGVTIHEDVHRRGMKLRGEGVTWNEIVQMGVNALHERHVLNEGGESITEERLREIVREELEAHEDRLREIDEARQ